MSHLMNTYARLPVAFTHGQGAWLHDAAGNKYLDALAGIAVNGLGHAHPQLVAALRDQVGKLIHTSNVYRVTEQEQLANRLCALSGMQEVFFGNSGAEANEGALKLVRFFGHKHGESEAQTIVMEHAWHGRTLATLAATGSEKARKGFDPLPGGFIRVPYNDLAAVENIAARDKRVRAVWLEVLQGEGGIRVADVAYVRALAPDVRRDGLAADDRRGAVGHRAHRQMVRLPVGGDRSGRADARQGSRFRRADRRRAGARTGRGRVRPGQPRHDLRRRTARLPRRARDPAHHRDGRPHAERHGARLADPQRLQQGAGRRRRTGGDPRRGLMIGIELDRPCGELVKQALDAGLLINVTAGHVIRLVPPLVIDAHEADEIVARLAPLVRAFLAGAARRAA